MIQPKEQRVSYSALADLDQCSMKFYMGRILGLPQKVWDKTTMGSLTHSILECLAKAKHKIHYDSIIVCIDPLDLSKKVVRHERSEAIRRLVKAWVIKHNIKIELLADLDSMLTVALVNTDFFFAGAIKVYPPEHEFIEVVNGARLKGFIDSMADMGDYFIVRDWKTAGQKMTKNDVQNSYQTRMYQWYIRRKFGKPCVVEYVFLRHGPTTRTKDKHIMRVEPSTIEQEKGFEYYASSMYKPFNNFGIPEAHSAFCRDEGFCSRVCSYFSAFSYWSITKIDGTFVRNVWIDPKNPIDILPKIEDNEVCTKMYSKGCPKYNT